jgi:cobalt/nickel transport system permease protein
MNLEPFVRGDSALHRLDPRVKVTGAAAFALVAALARDLHALVPALIAAAGLAAWARLELRALARRLLLVNGFFALLWLFLPFTYPGETLFAVGPLSASRAGLRFTLILTLRANAIVLSSIALLGTTTVFNLVHALQHLHLPAKLVHIFFFCYRYIDVIQREYLRLRQAMRIRGFRPRTNLHTYRAYAYLVGMLLVRSYERSGRIYQAMLCRGFKGDFPVYRHFSLGRSDLIHLGIIAAIVVGLATLQAL